ncbi:MAG: ATP-binding protein [Verrucomicrobiota bacterium]|nr:ATP-binding protein [Verrucomicrobiota bacterium]
MHASICDILTDIVQNAIEAGASRVELDVRTGPDRIGVRVADNGKGMDSETLRMATNPFFSEAGKHSRRRVGLGLPLLLQTAEAAGGWAKIESAPGAGTTVTFEMDARNLDTPPMGDLPGTLLGLLTFGDCELAVTRATPTDSYTLSRSELTDALGTLSDAGALALARDFLRSQEDNLIHNPTPRIQEGQQSNG